MIESAGMSGRLPLLFVQVNDAQLVVQTTRNTWPGVVGVFSRPTHDDGAGLVFNFGGGIRYFVHKNVALGGELSFTLGPAWYSETCNGCDNGRTEFYRAISFATGAEFIL